MPVITIDMAAVTKEKKAALVRTLTRNASEITGIAEEKFIVLINELERGGHPVPRPPCRRRAGRGDHRHAGAGALSQELHVQAERYLLCSGADLIA